MKAQQQGLTTQSQNAIGSAAARYHYDAKTFTAAVLAAAGKNGVDPNILVGLGYRESSLNPSAKNGGLFQIQDPSAYGIKPGDIGSFAAQLPAAAKVLSSNIKAFHGNVDLGIASWTLGVGGTRHLFSTGGMQAVRSAWQLATFGEQAGWQISIFNLRGDQKFQLGWESGKLDDSFSVSSPDALKIFHFGNEDAVAFNGCAPHVCPDVFSILLYVPSKGTAFTAKYVWGKVTYSPTLGTAADAQYKSALDQLVSEHRNQ